MISTRGDLVLYLQADLARYAPSRPGQVAALLTQPQVRWQVRLRLTEWWCNTRRGPLGRLIGAVARQRLMSHGNRLGYTFPFNVAGAGLKLPHVGTIVVSGDARIGANCQILHNVTLGATASGAPRLGDSVFVGAGSVVMGGITVGEGAVIGAGSVVVTDVPAGQTVVAAKALPLQRSRPAAAR